MQPWNFIPGSLQCSREQRDVVRGISQDMDDREDEAKEAQQNMFQQVCRGNQHGRCPVAVLERCLTNVTAIEEDQGKRRSHESCQGSR